MRHFVGAAIVTVGVAAGWFAALPPVAVRQPIAFPHAKHQSVGCVVCHRGAVTATHAGVPDISVCSKCHGTAPAGSGAAWTDAVAGRPIAWKQVTQIPPHVMFSHRRHVTLARLDCASCHGEMRERRTPVATAQVRLTMTTCLSCHRHEGAAEDCAACHR